MMWSKIVAASSLLALTQAAPSSTTTATVTEGRIEGLFLKSNVKAYLGIPFAQTPPERFSAPKDHAPFTETLLAKKVKPACIQQFSGDAKAQNFTKSIFSNPMPEESEDCLYLNIWVPPGKAPEGGFDVMFWIYGGNLQFGTASLEMYDGDKIAKNKGLMVVSANYRTNVFGFPNSPELPEGEGNPGFLDQRKALKWTRDNIKSFGGNPDKVTLFGESAGAWSIKQLIALPPSPLPFRAAIMQSEAAGLSGGAQSWINLGNALNCTGEKTLACIRAAPASKIIDIIGPKAMQFDPVKDDVTCSTNISTVITSGKAAKVPLILGSNANDGSVFAVVFGGGDPAAVTPEMGTTITDLTFQCPASFIGQLATASRFPSVYRYYYNVSLTKYEPFVRAGAYHSGEIPLIFGTYEKNRIEYKKVSETMQTYWTDFAKNPMRPLRNWRKLTQDKSEVMVFNLDESKPVPAESLDTSCKVLAADLIKDGL